MRSARALGLGLGVALLAGCAPATASVAGTTPPPQTGEHLAARRAAGVPDCPASDATTAPRADGLPNLVLECLGGTSTVRLAGLRGRPTLVVVWAQWCGPCRDELPVLARALGEFDGRVSVVLVEYGELSYPAGIALLKESGLTRYPVLVDPGKQLVPALGAEGIPRSYVLDADGRIVDRHTGGYKGADDLRASLAKAGVR